MIRKITGFLDLIITFIKAWGKLLVVFLFVISILIWLRERLFLNVVINLPVFVFVLILSLAIYPVAKFVEWMFFRKQKPLIEFTGLLWKPSRFSFRNPTPLCPKCKSRLLILTEYDSVHLVRSVQDIENLNRKLERHIYECPNHEKVLVSSEPIGYLHALAKAKIDNEYEMNK